MRGERERRERIVERVRRDGFASNEALAQHFQVTPQTIRRDLAALCAAGRLRRWHGGAGLPSSVENLAYPTRQVLCLAEKRRIAQLVARHIPNAASLFVNIGTTTEEVARALLDHQRLRVITNNLNVAQILAGKEDFEVIVAGGLVRARDRGIVGEATIDLIRQFKVDIGIIGISGIDPDGTLLDYDYREVRVAQAIVANSRRVFLAADRTKFGRNAMVRMGHVKDVDVLFTDAEPPASVATVLREAGGEVLIAEAESA
jgi:DeoR family glycerol-3-phosphate regulon repressor